MTKDDLYYYIQIKKTLEFTYNNKTYQLYYDKTDSNKEVIMFGQLYECKPFNSFGDLYNNARVESHFLKNVIEIL